MQIVTVPVDPKLLSTLDPLKHLAKALTVCALSRESLKAYTLDDEPWCAGTCQQVSVT